MREGKYAKTPTKIVVKAIFLMQDVRRNFLPNFIEICMETPCWSHPYWNHGGRRPTETSVTDFSYKNVNLSVEEL